MKRIITIVTAIGIGLVGCGSDDDTESVTETTTEASMDEASGDDDVSVEESSVDESAPEESSDSGGSTVAEPDAESSDDATTLPDAAEDSGTSAADRDVIRTIDDIPEACRDEMAAFLREIEPTVSSIDWETASISDFESIADVFTEETAAFEAASETAGCNDLAFEENGEFDLLVEFAEQEAPGVTGFFEFLDLMREASSTGGDETATTLETCADGIEFVEGLLAEYETIREVPASQLATFQQLPQVFVSCTPEEATFFDREDVDAFLNE